MKSLESSLLDFLDYLRDIKGYGDATLKTYDEAVGEMSRYCLLEEDAKGVFLDLMPWRVAIADQNAKTIAKKLSAVRSFVKYLKSRGMTVRLRSDDSVKVAKTLPKPIAHAHIVQALQGADLQERLVVVMLYTLGMRIGELASLRIEDIGKEWVRVSGKGDKERFVPLLDNTRNLIDEYLRRHSPKTYLFERKGGKLSENSLRYIVSKLFKKVGLKVTPHQLRHAYATELLAHNARIVDVSELLGHDSLETTQIYTKLSSAHKMKSYKAAHPLCKDPLGTT